MIKALRNLGFVRDAHVSSLEYQEEEYQEKSDYLTEISSFSWPSKDSVITKLIPFLGGGATLTLGIGAAGQQNNVVEATIPTLRDLLTLQGVPAGLTTQSLILLFIASGIVD